MVKPTRDAALAYWQQHLDGVPPLLVLPVARLRRPDQPYRAGRLRLDAGAIPSAERHDRSIHTLTALLVLLHRYSEQTDLLVGVDRAVLEPGERCGEDLVALRIRFASGLGADEAMDLVVQSLTECGRHAEPSFSDVVRAAGVVPSASHHPLVQVVFSRSDSALQDWPGAPEGSVPPDLALQLTGSAGSQQLHLIFNQELLDRAAADRLGKHLVAILRCMAETPSQAIGHIPLVGDDELESITRRFNATASEFPSQRCLHQLFEDRVDAAPGAVAAICGEEALTYAELEERGNRLAHYLRQLGVGPSRWVGICVERSPEMVIGLLAIAKAGGAYLPLDPSYPKGRLAWMLKDTNLSVILTLDRLLDRFPDSKARLLCLDSEWDRIAELDASRPDSGVTPADLAYVIYTSGSTGNPKGVMLDHRGRVNNFRDFNRRFSVGVGDRLLALSSLSFDMTAYDVFGILAAGATIVMPTARLEREPAHWAHLIRRHQVTLWHSAPAMLEMLVENTRQRPALHPRSLRLCLLGGDWIPVSLPDRLRALAGELQVISLGGATEVSMDSTIYEVTETDASWTSVPYGRPMANQLAYVLDQHSRNQPLGVPGELHLGGVGVARGYLERPALTAEKFVPNPYSGAPGDRMYRTGDLARLMDDGTPPLWGNLELLGRIDHQIKIRGHRIELGEIEATLEQHQAVREAVVVAQGDRGGDKRLVGYVVPELSSKADEERPHWDREQVDEWRAVYDEIYAQPSDPIDPTFNTIGWNSSYTGLPIPDEEMREWVDTTVERIRALRPRRVLEIGCGTGLMLFRLAPDCERYVGTDLSAVGLESIQRQLKGRGLDQVELRHQEANDFSRLDPRSYDLVILNSITQLFSSVAYLLEVLEGAVDRIREGGFLFVGDNRDLRLMDALHTAIQLSQAPASVPREDLPERIRQSIAQEEQLLLDPALFQALPSHLPRITSTTIQIKRGEHRNELTRFRYDVIAAIEAVPEDRPATETLHWLEDELSLDALRALLAEGPDRLDVRGIPNARLAAILSARASILGADGPTTTRPATAGLIRDESRATEAADRADPSAADPEALARLADELGYEIFPGHSGGSPGDFDAVFRRPRPGAAPPALPGETITPGAWSGYGNQPLRGRLNLRLPGELRDFLQSRLPDTMVPTTVVLLDRLPLSPNGKVDRKGLPEPEQSRPELDAPLVPPRNALEQILTSIWEETLVLGSIGVHDGFLELGGHSLLAIQIQSRIHELFPVEIPLRHFFGNLTIEGLAEQLREAGTVAGVDVEVSAELVMQYSDLSVEELEAELEKNAAEEQGNLRA